jgi:hypothetical protein
MGREMLCTAGRRINDYYVVKVEGEREENCCVPLVERLVIVMW